MTPHLTVAERRARLVRRDHLARTAATVSDAVAGVVALHSSDPALSYLAARARVGGFSVGNLDQELFEDRTIDNERLPGPRGSHPDILVP